MCFTCEPVALPVGHGCAVVYQRGYDPYTRPTDFDLAAQDVAGFHRGLWCYVSLSATVVDAAGDEVASYCLYGVPERPEAPCAFQDVDSLRWVTQQALGRAFPPDTP